jgi:hypothetical protein
LRVIQPCTSIVCSQPSCSSVFVLFGGRILTVPIVHCSWSTAPEVFGASRYHETTPVLLFALQWVFSGLSWQYVGQWNWGHMFGLQMFSFIMHHMHVFICHDIDIFKINNYLVQSMTLLCSWWMSWNPLANLLGLKSYIQPHFMRGRGWCCHYTPWSPHPWN